MCDEMEKVEAERGRQLPSHAIPLILPECVGTGGRFGGQPEGKQSCLRSCLSDGETGLLPSQYCSATRSKQRHLLQALFCFWFLHVRALILLWILYPSAHKPQCSPSHPIPSHPSRSEKFKTPTRKGLALPSTSACRTKINPLARTLPTDHAIVFNVGPLGVLSIFSTNRKHNIYKTFKIPKSPPWTSQIHGLRLRHKCYSTLHVSNEPIRQHPPAQHPPAKDVEPTPPSRQKEKQSSTSFSSKPPKIPTIPNPRLHPTTHHRTRNKTIMTTPQSASSPLTDPSILPAIQLETGSLKNAVETTSWRISRPLRPLLLAPVRLVRSCLWPIPII